MKKVMNQFLSVESSTDNNKNIRINNQGNLEFMNQIGPTNFI